jgi:tripartite-type tricarboxylate transporter receptor subunit TctC
VTKTLTKYKDDRRKLAMKYAKSYGLIFVTAVLLAGTAQLARAQYPEKPVEMTVLFGGSAQTVGQVLADAMSKRLGKSVVAVSRPGGGGAIGYTYVQSQPADGYNIVWNSNSISTTHYRGNLKFDYKAFTPIARIGVEVPVLAVNAKSGWKTLKDMAAHAKKSKQKLRVAMAGVGSFTHIASAALFNRLGVEVTYIPFTGGREIAEILAERVDAALRWPSEVQSHVSAGTIRVLCATSKESLPIGLNVPTCDKAGAKGLDMTMWRGLAAPAGTPPAVIAKLQEAAKSAVESPEFKAAVTKIGFTPAFQTAAGFGNTIAADDAEIAKLMAELGLKK